MDDLTIDPAIVRMSLPELVDNMRDVVLARLHSTEDRFPVSMKMAMENVEALDGIDFGVSSAPWLDDDMASVVDNDDGPIPDEDMMPVECAAFCCATIGVHNDADTVPRYSNLLYLGTPEGSDAVHRMYVIPRVSRYEEINDWTKSGFIPPADLARVQTVVLAPGMVVQLDGHCPHWLTVERNGVEIGEPVLLYADPNNISACLVGERPEDVVGLFVACAADKPIPDNVVVAAFSSMTLQVEPEPDAPAP